MERQSVTPFHCICGSLHNYVLYMHCIVNNSEICNSDELDIGNAVLLDNLRYICYAEDVDLMVTVYFDATIESQLVQ